ncbi:MAG: hypothetical protein JSU93_04445 [Methanobacteriota archaeon]|nr:MAG: hypothetical protein JSU93_04445 [Euryarchaeota archaeon]
MRAQDAWRVFTILFILGLAVAASWMTNQGQNVALVAFMAVVSIAVYFYIIYKRYHVERLPESDLRLFDDPEDLRILCRIYGIPDTGSPTWLRHRLAQFIRQNESRSFVWVAPIFMKKLVSNLELSPNSEDYQEFPESQSELLERMVSSYPSAAAEGRPLVWGVRRSTSRRHAITSCPICDEEVDRKSLVCDVCGADLEFYEVLSESKVGRKLVAQRAERHLQET